MSQTPSPRCHGICYSIFSVIISQGSTCSCYPRVHCNSGLMRRVRELNPYAKLMTTYLAGKRNKPIFTYSPIFVPRDSNPLGLKDVPYTIQMSLLFFISQNQYIPYKYKYLSLTLQRHLFLSPAT